VRSARVAAGVAWVYAACWGIPAVPVSVFIQRYYRLPNFMCLFDVYAGPWWPRSADAFTLLLLAFLGVTLLAAWSGRLLWRGSRAGAVLNLVLLRLEARRCRHGCHA
jgi:hypothetical protein